MRAFRVFRLFKRVKSLHNIVLSLIKSAPGVANGFVVLLLVMAIYSILGQELPGRCLFFWGKEVQGDEDLWKGFGTKTRVLICINCSLFERCYDFPHYNIVCVLHYDVLQGFYNLRCCTCSKNKTCLLFAL